MLVQFAYFGALLLVAFMSAAAFRFMRVHSRPTVNLNYGATPVLELDSFNQQLTKEITRAERLSYPLTVVSLHFQALRNDEPDTSYSAAVKESLSKVGGSMPNVRQYDLLGLDSDNDKIVAAFPGADREQVQKVVERISYTLERELSVQLEATQRFCIGSGLILDDLTVRAHRESIAVSSAG